MKPAKLLKVGKRILARRQAAESAPKNKTPDLDLSQPGMDPNLRPLSAQQPMTSSESAPGSPSA